MLKKTSWLVLFLTMIGLPAGTPAAATNAGFALQGARREPPPVALWGPGAEVDEPESAFYSLGRTPRHFGHHAALIAGFHEWLGKNGVAPLSLLPGDLKPPADLRRILVEPELQPNCGWRSNGNWIISGGGHRGPEARFPLHIERSGLYRLWIRYFGSAKGVTVNSLTLSAKGRESEAPLVYEEFNTRPAAADGPAWHDLLVDLPAGDYTLVLGYVVRSYHAAQGLPFAEPKVDCFYLTDELWAPAPAEETLASLRPAPGAGIQGVTNPPLDPAALAQWKLWQTRPSHWETARANEPLFRQSYAYWRDTIEAIARQDYQAPPCDAVRGGIADYRDPRRQVIFDPVWNMVGNPCRIRRQIAILEGDIDPLAKDAFFDAIAPGYFPIVRGQWERSGGGLTADHAAVNALALGSYTVPHGGLWHLWINFKNINYFEYYGVYADTVQGRAAVWERKERLYPGGRGAWAKVGTIPIPELTEAETAAHKERAAKGVFVQDGEAVFVHQQGAWKREGQNLVGAGTTNALLAGCALRTNGDFCIQARLTISGLQTSGAAFFFKDGLGLEDNRIGFEGALSGPSVGKIATNGMAGRIRNDQPFDFKVERKDRTLTLGLDGAEVGCCALKDGPQGWFGFRPGSATLRIERFAATGDLDDGLALMRRITIGLWIDKYINARTYRGVYGLRITDDGDYQPEGALAPKPSPGRYFAQLKSIGATPEGGYAMNAGVGIGLASQTWMPGRDATNPVLSMALARDGFRSAGLFFRSAQCGPVVLRIEAGPLTGGLFSSYAGRVQWRAVGFAPYGEGREEWTPFFLLRRPFLALPPLGAAQAWLTVDATGVAPGNYTSRIRITAADWDGQRVFPERVVKLKVRVADVRIAPKRPILLHGWVTPPPGEEYRADWFKRFNVWQGDFFSRADMEKYGLKLQIWCQRHASSNQIAQVIAEAKKLGLGYDDWMFSVMDEPTGKTAAELRDYLAIGKMIRAADPKVKITMNPGEAANAATFQILQPYVDLWNPYRLHLSYGPSGRDYLKKPWIWYETSCYQDKSPGMASEIYGQIRSVLSQPADCRGTAFFAPYYPWRDPWDTAYEHIKDVSVFVLPSRHGPVPTPSWEAILEAVQHANLARMVRERARPDDVKARALWENGSLDDLLAWLE